MTDQYELGVEGERWERIERARSEALPVIERALTDLGRVEDMVGVSLTGNHEVRSDVTLPPGVVLEWESTEEQMRQADSIITRAGERRMRDVMARHGIGRERDITPAEVGLPLDAPVLAEGGMLPSKMRAQKSMVLARFPAAPAEEDGGEVPEAELTGSIVQLASVHRKLRADTGELEVAAGLAQGNPEAIEHSAGLLRSLGIDAQNPKNERDAAVLLWAADPDFVPAEMPAVIASVDVNGALKGPGEVEDGRLVVIGSIRGRAVYLQEVPRVMEVDEAGNPVMNSLTKRQVYTQPTSSQIAAAQAGLFGSEVMGVATGATFMAETIADGVEVTLDRALDGQPAVLITPFGYGTSRAAAVQGKEPQLVPLPVAFGAVNKAERVFRRARGKVLAAR